MRGFRIFDHTEKVGGAPLTVLRLLTPLKMSYEAERKRAEPYTQIAEELPEMRRDTGDLVKKTVGGKRKAYVFVNNCIEGNAPPAKLGTVSITDFHLGLSWNQKSISPEMTLTRKLLGLGLNDFHNLLSLTSLASLMLTSDSFDSRTPVVSQWNSTTSLLI
jgi:hypothetical protein